MQGDVININEIRDKKNNEKIKENNEIDLVRRSGLLEIEEYKKLVGDFINNVSNLSMFEVMMKEFMAEELQRFLIEEFLEGAVKPIFVGERPSFMEVDEYEGARYDMFENLVDRYINKNK